MSWLSTIFGKKDINKKRIEMIHIFNEHLSGKGNSSDHFKWVVTSINKGFSSQGIDELKEELLSIEQKALRSPSPVPLLRSAIMDMLDSSAFNSALLELNDDEIKAINSLGENFTNGVILGLYLSSEFQTSCLRIFSVANYSDGSQNDWFSLYASAATDNGKHMAHIMLANVDKYDGDPAFLAQLHEPYQLAMAQLRNNLLSTPVGAIFPDK